MSFDTIAERCSCGATFTINSSYQAREAAGEWREKHHHEFKPEPASVIARPTVTMRVMSARLRRGRGVSI